MPELSASQRAFLRSTLSRHIQTFFGACPQLDIGDVRLEFFENIPPEQASKVSPITFPATARTPSNLKDVHRVKFGSVTLSTVEPTPKPGPDWSGWPSESSAYWYIRDDGLVIPAWNALGVLTDLLLLRDEAVRGDRDHHGRVTGEGSRYVREGLHVVPWFNELAFATVAVMCRHKLDRHGWDILQPRFMASLSHDCDVLLGDEFWTQAGRLFRFFKPLGHARLPDFSQVRHIAANAIDPRQHSLGNIPQIISLEKEFGFHSSFYFLNGKRGRYASRTPNAAILDAAQLIPDAWEIGLHYNYDTYRAPSRLHAQKRELEALIDRSVSAGRAHYLRFDPIHSPNDLEIAGIQVDESIGFPYHPGHRMGIAGAFKPMDGSGSRELDVLEIPLTFMDASIRFDSSGHDPESFESIARHVANVGGLIGILVHPDVFDSPEHPRFLGRYRYILEYLSRLGCCTILPREVRRQFAPQ